jgi:hypothetical protein
MASFKIRPRFEIELDENPETIYQNFLNKKEKMDCGCMIEAIPDHIVLKNKTGKNNISGLHKLTLILEDTDAGSVVRGTYGPNGNVWTLFAGAYFACGVLITFISIIGFSRKSLGMEAQILWLLPILIGIIVVLYIASQFGQKLGAEQMFDLHFTAQEVLGEKIHFY